MLNDLSNIDVIDLDDFCMGLIEFVREGLDREFGTAILNSEEEKKETHPKGVPSTSGSSATGMPPNDDDPKDSNISFGENSNQLHHTWRHVDKIGLPRSQVQDAIQKDILKRNISKLEIQKPHNFNTVVNGRKIQYTVYRINSTETRIQ